MRAPHIRIRLGRISFRRWPSIMWKVDVFVSHPLIQFKRLLQAHMLFNCHLLITTMSFARLHGGIRHVHVCVCARVCDYSMITCTVCSWTRALNVFSRNHFHVIRLSLRSNYSSVQWFASARTPAPRERGKENINSPAE